MGGTWLSRAASSVTMDQQQTVLSAQNARLYLTGGETRNCPELVFPHVSSSHSLYSHQGRLVFQLNVIWKQIKST